MQPSPLQPTVGLAPYQATLLSMPQGQIFGAPQTVGQPQLVYVLTPINATSTPLAFHPMGSSLGSHPGVQGLLPHMMAPMPLQNSMPTVRVGGSATSPPGPIGSTHNISSPPLYHQTGGLQSSMRPSPTRSAPTPVQAVVPPAAVQMTSLDDDLEGTLNEMTIRTGTAATINSIEDFLATVPVYDDPAARRVIDDLRKEITDKVIRSKVMRLPRETCESMVAVFEADNALMQVQCTRERGNIVAPLIEKLGPDATFPLIRFALENLVSLSHSQGGCIALPRILAFTKPSQTEVFFEQVLEVMPELFCHQYGNFVVKHFLSTPTYCAAIINRHLLSPGTFATWATTRSGSHLIDEIFKNAEPQAIAALCKGVFMNFEDLRRLSFDQFGNYSVQSGFKALETRCGDAQLHAQCAAVATRAAKDSPFAQNIMKRVSQGYKTLKTSKSSPTLDVTTPNFTPVALANTPTLNRGSATQLSPTLGM